MSHTLYMNPLPRSSHAHVGRLIRAWNSSPPGLGMALCRIRYPCRGRCGTAAGYGPARRAALRASHQTDSLRTSLPFDFFSASSPPRHPSAARGETFAGCRVSRNPVRESVAVLWSHARRLPRQTVAHSATGTGRGPVHRIQIAAAKQPGMALQNKLRYMPLTRQYDIAFMFTAERICPSASTSSRKRSGRKIDWGDLSAVREAVIMPKRLLELLQ